MRDLNECRACLNDIDDKLKELFLKRMAIVEEVKAYKKANGLATYDATREKAMKERLLSEVDNKFRPYYEELLDTILKVSKDYQDA